MKVIRFPGDISRDILLETYAENMLECIKESMITSFDQLFTPEGDDSWWYYLKKNLDNEIKYILLTKDKRVQGYLVWNQKKDVIEIYDLYIRPEYQMDIITLRKLLKEFAEDISTLDASKIWAYTNYKNKRMNSILRRHSFSESQRKRNGTVYISDIENFKNKFVKEDKR
jgi:hypothetical protein